VTTAASSLAVTLREASVGAVISPENVVPDDVSIAIDNSRMPGDRKRLVKPAFTTQSGCRYNARNVPTDRLAPLISVSLFLSRLMK